MHPTETVPQLVGELYRVVQEFERLFPGRRFTPDGHLVGSIGEVMVSYRYGLELLPHSYQGHDARAPNGTLVEIKATQGSSVALREEPQHLLVVHLGRQGQISEIFNGPGSIAWSAAGKMQRNGQRPISLFKLKALMVEVAPQSRLSLADNPSVKGTSCGKPQSAPYLER